MTDALGLGFDTAGPYCAAALVRGTTVLDTAAQDMARGQAEALLGLLEDLLIRHRAKWSDLQALGVGTGPGNFTGVRISVSAARGLALGLSIPAYGVTGFEAQAQITGNTRFQCLPAPRDQLYVQRDGQAALVAQHEVREQMPDAATPAQIAEAVALIACARCPDPAPAPAPYYLRAPDAAPAKDKPPAILP